MGVKTCWVAECCVTTLAAIWSQARYDRVICSRHCQQVGQFLQGNALLIPKVNNWEYSRAEGDSFGKVGLGLRLVDVSNGALVWKGRHEKVQTYMVFKPALKDIAEDLAETMVKHLPK